MSYANLIRVARLSAQQVSHLWCMPPAVREWMDKGADAPAAAQAAWAQAEAMETETLPEGKAYRHAAWAAVWAARAATAPDAQRLIWAANYAAEAMIRALAWHAIYLNDVSVIPPSDEAREDYWAWMEDGLSM